MEKASKSLEAIKENGIEENQEDSFEQIKSVVVFSKQGELEGINSLELEKEGKIENNMKEKEDRCSK